MILVHDGDLHIHCALNTHESCLCIASSPGSLSFQCYMQKNEVAWHDVGVEVICNAVHATMTQQFLMADVEL